LPRLIEGVKFIEGVERIDAAKNSRRLISAHHPDSAIAPINYLDVLNAVERAPRLRQDGQRRRFASGPGAAARRSSKDRHSRADGAKLGRYLDRWTSRSPGIRRRHTEPLGGCGGGRMAARRNACKNFVASDHQDLRCRFLFVGDVGHRGRRAGHAARLSVCRRRPIGCGLGAHDWVRVRKAKFGAQ